VNTRCVAKVCRGFQPKIAIIRICAFRNCFDLMADYNQAHSIHLTSDCFDRVKSLCDW
jgi:hypothetical protein